MSSRIYLDYNATSPLTKSVIDYFVKGDFSFGNPQSQHSSGQKALAIIEDVREFLFEIFSLDSSDYHLFFNSGATESINSIFSFDIDDLFVYSKADHMAVLAQNQKVKHSYSLKLEQDTGLFDLSDLLIRISEHKENFPNSKVFINYTWVHNEFGLVWDLELVDKLKKIEDVYIHVDAVQAPFKIKDWNKLSPNIDGYSFSAHKFGALKGIGFTFLKKSFPFRSYITGGGQQGNLRAGTENPLAIWSIKLAMQDMQKNYLEDFNTLNQLKIDIESIFLAKKNFLLPFTIQAVKKNNNTLFIVDKSNHSDFNLIKYDLNGLEVSSGSACSSGSTKDSHTLRAYNFNKNYLKNGFRISLGYEHILIRDELIARIKKLIN